MTNCIVCNQEIAIDARICPKCGANQFQKITLIGIFLSLLGSFLIAAILSIIIGYFQYGDFNGTTLNVYYILVGIVFIITLYKDYNTKKIR